MSRPYDASYHSRYPQCTGCGIVYRADAMVRGKCEKCRDCITINVIHLLNILMVILGFIAVALIAGCADEPPQGGKSGSGDGLTWARCYDHGDWRETPFCDAAARGMEGV